MDSEKDSLDSMLSARLDDDFDALSLFLYFDLFLPGHRPN